MRFTVAQRFCTLAQGHGRVCTPTGERSVRVTAETEADFTAAQRAAANAVQILKVQSTMEFPDVFTFDISL